MAIVFLAPVLSQALDTAERYRTGDVGAEQVAQAIVPALTFVQEGIHLFGLLNSGILRNDEVEELIRQIGLEHQAQVAALEGLRQSAADGKVHSVERHAQQLRAASERLLTLFAQLQENEHKEKIYSPYPVLDHFIKTGINLLNGYLPPFEIQTRLSSVIGLVEGLKSDLARFERLYSGSQSAQAARPWFDQLESGVGAAMTYLNDTNQKKALEDSLKLLGHGSTRLAECFQSIDKEAAAHPKYSRHRYLEELGRAAQAHQENQVELPVLLRTWAGVQEALGHYQRELDGIRRFPLFVEIEPLWKSAHEACEATRVVVAEVSQQISERLSKAEALAPELFRLADLEARFSALVSALEPVQKRLAEEVGRFSAAPHLEALRELVDRALAGSLPKSELKAGLHHFQESQQQVMASMAQGACDPLSAELANYLAAHGTALERMKLYLEDPDPDHLRQGWQLIAVTLPRVIELSEQLREQVAAQTPETGPKQVTCFKCGASNHHDRRFCQQCNAPLPKMTVQVTEYTDIVGGGPSAEAATGPSNLIKLEQLALQAEAGQLTREQLGQELDTLLKQADRTRQTFEKQVITLMGQDSGFDAYAQFFAIKMNAFVQGLLQMRDFAEGGALSQLHSGLVACREAGEELAAFQQQINTALGQGR